MNNIEGVDLLISADVNKKKKIRKFPGMYGTRTDLSIIRKCNSSVFRGYSTGTWNIHSASISIFIFFWLLNARK